MFIFRGLKPVQYGWPYQQLGCCWQSFWAKFFSWH